MCPHKTWGNWTQIETQTHIEKKDHVQTAAEIGTIELQNKKHQEWLVATRDEEEARNESPLEPSEAAWTC